MSTVVSFHAHPDDEAQLTGGTLAKLAAEGHRVVIVVATDGSLTARKHDGDNVPDRLAELADSARALGVAQVEFLGYADSGHGPVLYPIRPAGSDSSVPRPMRQRSGSSRCSGTPRSVCCLASSGTSSRAAPGPACSATSSNVRQPACSGAK
jgi:LmbE family N-acetylglucosaminyl deacetylase